ncbi:unnamed protein product [Closterium sp. NIES-54]
MPSCAAESAFVFDSNPAVTATWLGAPRFSPAPFPAALPDGHVPQRSKSIRRRLRCRFRGLLTGRSVEYDDILVLDGLADGLTGTRRWGCHRAADMSSHRRRRNRALMNSMLNPAANTSHPLLLTRPRRRARRAPKPSRHRFGEDFQSARFSFLVAFSHNVLQLLHALGREGGVEQVLLDDFLNTLHDRSNQPLLDKLELLLDGVLARFCDSGCHPLDDFPAHLVELRACPFQQLPLLRDTVYGIAALLQRALRRLRNHIPGPRRPGPRMQWTTSNGLPSKGPPVRCHWPCGVSFLLRRVAPAQPPRPPSPALPLHPPAQPPRPPAAALRPHPPAQPPRPPAAALLSQNPTQPLRPPALRHPNRPPSPAACPPAPRAPLRASPYAPSNLDVTLNPRRRARSTHRSSSSRSSIPSSSPPARPHCRPGRSPRAELVSMYPPRSPPPPRSCTQPRRVVPPRLLPRVRHPLPLLLPLPPRPSFSKTV